MSEHEAREQIVDEESHVYIRKGGNTPYVKPDELRKTLDEQGSKLATDLADVEVLSKLQR